MGYSTKFVKPAASQGHGLRSLDSEVSGRSKARNTAEKKAAYMCEANHNSPSNTRTAYESDLAKHGSSGSTRATPRGLSRVSETSRAASRFPGGRT